LRLNHEDPTSDFYNQYAVVPKVLYHAQNSLKRYDWPPGPYEDLRVQNLYLEAAENLYKILLPICGDSEQFSYDKVLSTLNPLKASGYPIKMKYPIKLDYWLSDDQEFFDLYWELLPTKMYIRTLCNVSIKEELREIEKVQAGKVRTIIAMDVNHVVAHNMLCKHQDIALKENCYKTPFMVGLNLLNGGATKLRNYMSPIGWNGPCTIELDGKQFDGKCKYDPHFKSIGDIRWRLLALEYRTPENKERLKNIYYELCNSPLVNIDGHVYCRCCGNPSGQACTTCDNSFKNWMDMYVLWCLSTPKELNNLESFEMYVRVIIVGDDVSLSVHPDVQIWFNRQSIEKYAPVIGMEYHFAHDDFQYFENTTFLGHGFTKCEHPTGFEFLYPTINSAKMRASILHYNEEGTSAMTVIRACALRNETFANLEDRLWFSKLISFLRIKTSKDESFEMRQAWRSYLTDNELHELYSGVTINGDILLEGDFTPKLLFSTESEFDRHFSQTSKADLSLEGFSAQLSMEEFLGRISRVPNEDRVYVSWESALTL